MAKCAAFWKHINIRNNNQIYPCCRYKTPVATFDGDIESILDSEVYQQLRSAEYLQGCSKCYYEEAIGEFSTRQRFNSEYDTDTVELKYLEIGLDNICNLTCDGCNGEFSSAWSKLEHPDQPMSYHVKSTKDFKSVPSTVDKILFLGGEPLMTQRHVHILETVTDPGQTTVIYNTNGTFLLDDRTQQILQQFKQVEFILSIDGYAELNDQVRGGSKWQDILDFINQVSGKYKLTVNTVLHLNNWHGIKQLESFINTLDVRWTVRVLTYPEHLDMANYQNKQEIIDLLQTTNISNKEFLIKHLTSKHV